MGTEKACDSNDGGAESVGVKTDGSCLVSRRDARRSSGFRLASFCDRSIDGVVEDGVAADGVLLALSLAERSIFETGLGVWPLPVGFSIAVDVLISFPQYPRTLLYPLHQTRRRYQNCRLSSSFN